MPQAVNLILKRRIAEAGIDPQAFSAHSLRSGYLTETARRSRPRTTTMTRNARSGGG